MDTEGWVSPQIDVDAVANRKKALFQNKIAFLSYDSLGDTG
jgi:hypothetical protein